MKTIAIISLLVMITSCKEKHLQEKSLWKIDGHKNAEIFGNWTMCATSSNNVVNTFNSCPTISFKNNGIGLVTNSTKSGEFFTWALTDDTLTIVYSNNNGNQTFENAQYQTEFIKQGKQTLLDIARLDKDVHYHLSR